MIDFCRTTDAVILDHEVDLIIQQIDILFDTNPGEVLGCPTYGSDYERFIHELNIGSNTVANYIQNSIETNVDLFGWQLEVDAKFLVGEYNDIILVGIQFSKAGDAYTHVYKITTCPEEAPIS